MTTKLTAIEEVRLKELCVKAAKSDALQAGATYRGFCYDHEHNSAFSDSDEIDEYYDLVNRKYGLANV